MPPLRRVVSFTVLLCLAAACAAVARPPVEVLREANEQLHRFVLDNGMTCLVKEDHSAPVVAVEIWVGTGSIHEQEFLGGGLSHYLEHMVFKGTPTRAPGEISKTIDAAGGDINAYTGYDRTVFYTTMPSESWKTAVDVLSDAVLNASLPEEEWEREREVVLREVAMGRDDPARVLHKLLFRTAYREHPYQHPVIGHEDVLTDMTREQLETFHRRHYVTDNLITVVVGDVDAGEVEAYLRDTLGAVERRARAPVIVPQEPPQLTQRFARETGAYNVTRLEYVYHTVPLNHPDAPALDLLAQVAGHGRSSRLVRELKEERQLVHSIDAWSYTPKDPGLFGVSAVVDPGLEAEARAAIEEQVEGLRERPFSEADLEKARRQLLVSELTQLQTARGQAQNFASGEFYAGDPRYGETYLEAIQEVTPADLQRVARTYLRKTNRTVAILSPEGTEDGDAADAAASDTGEVGMFALENGVRVLVREDRRLPFVHFAVAMKGGLLSETAENNGISQLTSSLLTRGTEKRTAEEIAEQVESLGGSLSAFSGLNSIGLTAFCLSDDTETFMDLIADCLLHATLPEEEFEKQRRLQLAAIEQAREEPMFLANEVFTGLLFPDHPYRWDVLGTAETVASLTPQMAHAHLEKLVAGSNLVVSIFGDIDTETARHLATSWLSGIPAREVPGFDRAGGPAPDLPAMEMERIPKEQTILLVGAPGVAVDDPRADALDVLQNALSGLSSDLMIEIRDKRGLVYFTGAFNRPGLDPGSFGFYAGTQEESLEEVRGLIDEEIARITTEGLRQEELDRSRAQLVARHQRRLQNNGGLAQVCALNELYGLGYGYEFGTEARLTALTTEDVRRAAASILQPDRLAVAAVLPEPAGDEEKEEHP